MSSRRAAPSPSSFRAASTPNRPTGRSSTWPPATPGREARSLLSSYFACGDLDDLTGLFEDAGLRSPTTATHLGIARFPSVDALVAAEVDSTPLGERITAEVRDQIRVGARDVLAPFTTADGSLEAPFEVHVVAARRS